MHSTVVLTSLWIFVFDKVIFENVIDAIFLDEMIFFWTNIVISKATLI
jgi:hypothetical protein